MNFKNFFLEQIEGLLSNAQHHSDSRLAHGRMHSNKSLSLVADYRKKENHKDPKQESLKNGNAKIRRITNQSHLNKIVKDNGLNLANMTPEGLCLNGETGIVLKKDHIGFYLEIK